MDRNPAEASAFIIPFDAGVHSYIDHLNGKPRLASPHGWTAIKLLRKASWHKKVCSSNHITNILVTICNN